VYNFIYAKIGSDFSVLAAARAIVEFLEQL